MNIRYILPLLVLVLALPAQAQVPDDQVEPQIFIEAPASIATPIDNFTFEYPAGYVLPDTSVSAIVGASLFTANNDGVTPIADPYSEEGVSGTFILALDGEGGFSEACGDNSAGSPTIENDVSGKIVMVARGTCSFVFKTEIVQNLGGLGIIIYNPSTRDPDTIGNMIAGDGYEVQLTIPTMLMPYSMAAPIVMALDGGQTVTGIMRAYTAPVAVEDTPEAAALAFSDARPNPFSGSTSFKVNLPEAEALAIEVYDVQGRRVATLHNGLLPAGESTVRFDADALPSGVYVVRATGEAFSQARTVSVLR